MIAGMARPLWNHKKKILVVLLHQLDLLCQMWMMWMMLVHMCAIVIGIGEFEELEVGVTKYWREQM